MGNYRTCLKVETARDQCPNQEKLQQRYGRKYIIKERERREMGGNGGRREKGRKERKKRKRKRKRN